MRRLRPVPERYEDEKADREDGGESAGFAALVKDLKAALQRPAKADDALLSTLKRINRSLEHSTNGAANDAGPDAGPQLRLGVFADTANLTDRVNENPTVIDYEKLLERIIGGRRIVHARAYCPIYAEYGGRLEEQRTVSPVWGKGYDIVTKPVKLFADGTRKADLDLVLAVDVIRRIESMDVMALLSGDGDFVPVVDLVREKGVRVEVYAFTESMAEELRLHTDAFYDLHAMTEVHAAASIRSAG